jgi:hypothetical protein
MLFLLLQNFESLVRYCLVLVGCLDVFGKGTGCHVSVSMVLFIY